jgi:hypothetical protein
MGRAREADSAPIAAIRLGGETAVVELAFLV